MARYGQSAAVTSSRSGEIRELRAFVQPVRRTREDWALSASPLGAASRQRWLYIGRGDLPLAPGDALTCRGRVFTVQEAQVVDWLDGPLYCRAILRPGREAAV